MSDDRLMKTVVFGIKESGSWMISRTGVGRVCVCMTSTRWHKPVRLTTDDSMDHRKEGRKEGDSGVA